MQVGDGLARKLLESGHAHRVFGVDDVDEMVRHGRLFLGGGFGGADIHATVHLVGVRIHDFGPLPRFGQTPGDGDAQPRLAGRGGTDDGDDSLRHIRPLSAARNRSGRRPRRGRQADYGGRRV